MNSIRLARDLSAARDTRPFLSFAFNSRPPLPPPPIRYTPVVLAIWLALGLLVLLVMKLAGKEDWLIKAGRIAQERVETAEEASHRSLL